MLMCFQLLFKNISSEIFDVDGIKILFLTILSYAILYWILGPINASFTKLLDADLKKIQYIENGITSNTNKRIHFFIFVCIVLNVNALMKEHILPQ